MSDSEPSFEKVLTALGVPGRFQITQALLIMGGKVFISFMALSFVFIGYEPPHVCNHVNETLLLDKHGLGDDPSVWIHYDSCHIIIYSNSTAATTTTVTNTTTITTTSTTTSRSSAISSKSNSKHFIEVFKMTCPNGRNFSKAKETTLVSEWDLVCESKGTAELVETFAMLSGTASGFISTSVSDRFGRKTLLLGSTVLVMVFEAVVIFSVNIYMVMGLRLVSGFFYQGVISSYFVIGIELFIPRHRQEFGVVVCLAWVFNVLLFCGAAYGLQSYSWRYLQTTIVATGLVNIFMLCFVKESSRWLAVTNHRKKALNVLRFASKQNGKSFEKVKEKLVEFWTHLSSDKKDKRGDAQSFGDTTGQMYNDSDSGSNTNNRDECDIQVKKTRVTILTLLRSLRLLRLTFLTWFIWTTHNVTYYGLYMTSSNLTGNRFLNFTLMALVEIPSNFVILFMMNRMSRKPVLAFFLGLSAALLMASSLLLTFGDDSRTSNIMSTVFLIMGKFAIGSSFNVIFIMTPEIYPTNLRSIGYGINASGSKVGAMLAPFSRPLFTIAKWAPGLVFTIMCIISLIMITGLPETRYRNLPNCVDDVENRKAEKKDDERNGAMCTLEQQPVTV